MISPIVCPTPCIHGICIINDNITYCNCSLGWSPPTCSISSDIILPLKISHIILLFFSVLNFLYACFALYRLSNRRTKFRYMLWLATLASCFGFFHNVFHLFSDESVGTYSLDYIVGAGFAGLCSVVVIALQITVYMYWLAVTSEQPKNFISFYRPLAIIFIFARALMELLYLIILVIFSFHVFFSPAWYQTPNFISLSTYMLFTAVVVVISLVLLYRLIEIRNALTKKHPHGITIDKKLVFKVRFQHLSMDWMNSTTQEVAKNGEVANDYFIVHDTAENSVGIQENYRMEVLSLAIIFVSLVIVFNFILIALTICNIILYEMQHNVTNADINFLIFTGRSFVQAIVTALIVHLIRIITGQPVSPAVLRSTFAGYPALGSYHSQTLTF